MHDGSRRGSPAETPESLAETPAPRPQRCEPIDSERLLRGRRIIEIAHNGEVYRLQATRLGKLILTK